MYYVLAEFVTSRVSGGTVLKIDNYTFYKNRKTSWKQHWRCMNHKLRCKAVVHTAEDVVVFSNNFHNH